MDKSFSLEFGIKIKEARQRAKLSQEELAELINVDRTYISFLERGKRSPSLETLHSLLKVLNIDLNFIPYKWLQQLYQVCNKYNLEIETLAETIKDPKVIPMLRGKAFEFTACKLINKYLPNDKYSALNPRLNAQSTIKDVDIEVKSLLSNKKYSVECKLASKDSFKNNAKYEGKKYFSINVKCMRSRTLGEKVADQRAREMNVDKDILMIHNDQYVEEDFDFVITSMANAFYKTDKETGLYYWSPSNEGRKFLDLLEINNQKEAFYTTYIARSKDLAVYSNNYSKCTRKKCNNKTNCGFIPNYPKIYFDLNTGKVVQPWVEIKDFYLLLQN